MQGGQQRGGASRRRCCWRSCHHRYCCCRLSLVRLQQRSLRRAPPRPCADLARCPRVPAPPAPLPSEEGSRESVDAGCMRLTAPWVRERAQNDQDIETCAFFDGLDGAGPDGRLDPGGVGCPRASRQFLGAAGGARTGWGLVVQTHAGMQTGWQAMPKPLARAAWVLRPAAIDPAVPAPPARVRCPARRRVHAARPAGGGAQAPVVPLLSGPPHDCLRQRGRLQLPGKHRTATPAG